MTKQAKLATDTEIRQFKNPTVNKATSERSLEDSCMVPVTQHKTAAICPAQVVPILNIIYQEMHILSDNS